jgi:hypothetical protein
VRGDREERALTAYARAQNAYSVAAPTIARYSGEI